MVYRCKEEEAVKTSFTITPSWLIEKKKDWTDGVRNLERLGIRVRNRQFVRRLPSPQQKAAQLHRAFRDAKADIVLAQRGGYSSMQMLPFVDYALIRKNPKPLLGFSDLSTLLNTVYERTGLVTLHAPMVINFSNPTPFTVRSFLNALDGFPEADLFSGAPLTVYRHGTAHGTLKGGNLVTLSALIGTEWETQVDGAIVFFEDVDEKPHEVDRYLTQWILAGKLQKARGVILGDFRGVRNRDLFRVITRQMKVRVPVVHCPYIGHVKNKITLPVGATVELNTRAGTLVITG